MTNAWHFGVGVALLALGCGDPAGPVTSMVEGPAQDSDAGVSPEGDGDGEPWPEPGNGDGDGDVPVEQDGEPDEDAGPGGPPGPALPLDAMQMRGTHNSYHQAPSFAFDDTHKYTHAPLDVQLGTQGVRALELDLHRALSDDSIDVYHIVGIDAVTSCLNFEDCLDIMRRWSEAHPTHAPVIVWMEMKDDTGGPKFDGLDKVDEVLREVMGPHLLTPDDMMGASNSLHDAITQYGWPLVNDVRGKFLFIILNNDEDIERYTQGYTTTRGKAMFPRVNRDKFNSPVAAFAKFGIGDTDAINEAHAAKLMIATNVCTVEQADEACEESRLKAIDAGFHMLKDDLPAKISTRQYFLDLPLGKPVACNPRRAPADCTPEALESL